jgi:type VI protein secretion system component Hcp
MRRGFLAAGAAILVAAALAVPLWLAVDDDGGRRAGALGSPANLSVKLTIDGVSGGPFDVRNFSWESENPELEIVRAADSKSAGWLAFAGQGLPAKAAATLEVKGADGTGALQTWMTYRLTDPVVRDYRSTKAADESSSALNVPPVDTVVLGYTAIEHLAPKGAAVVPAPGAAYMRMTVPSASKGPIEIMGYKFGLSHPPGAKSGALASPLISSDRLVITRRLGDGLGAWFADARGGGTPLGTVTIELRRADGTGTVQTYATYKLEDAVVESVRDFGGLGVPGGGALQEVAFSFQTLSNADGSGCVGWDAPC